MKKIPVFTISFLFVSSLLLGMLCSTNLVSAASSLPFQDNFESNNFNAWTNVVRTGGETVSIASTPTFNGNFSAKFTNNGNATYERAYLKKSIDSSKELYARGYFYISQSGISKNGAYFYFLMFSSGSNSLAYAGWKQNSNGNLLWQLMIRNGTNYVAAYSTSIPVKNVWYCVELHWKGNSTNGLGELYVNDLLVYSIRNRNTSAYGNATAVCFGLSEIYNCKSTIAYLDNTVISLSRIGSDLPPSPPSPVVPVGVGIYPSSSKSISTYERDLNIKLDSILLFQPIKSLNYGKVTSYLNQGYDVILNVEFLDSFANLKNVTAGYYDKYLISLANAIKADGRTIWLRTLHEFNGDWYNWGTLYTGNVIADFIPAWRHVVQIFKDNNAPVKFQLDYNSGNGKNNKTPFSAFYPGDQYVDIVVITCYNRANTDEYVRPWLTFTQAFQNAYSQVTALTTKPVGVAETSSTSYSGNKSQWIIDTFHSIANDFPRVTQVTWFLSNKTVNSYIRDWDLNTDQEKLAFIQGLNYLRSVRGSYIQN